MPKDKKLSLHPLTVEEALKALLQVKPDPAKKVSRKQSKPKPSSNASEKA